ncbi:ferrous iron transport protein A [Enterococcus sp. HY326]|uniref:ferrous iron transport protein A n=1 Tax=Enterococcus sp. HY326 TaxID=2971265 RepID=UPI00223FFED5|nr:ferrous iron transport protein A [Enterococcus sp. HY326]
MNALLDMKENTTCRVKEIQLDDNTTRHLKELGIVRGSKIVITKLSKDNGIVLSQNARLAMSQQILAGIMVEEAPTEETSLHSLDMLAIGEKAKVVRIYGSGAVKRRLMDMGLTRGTEILVRNLAPLGDPIEITLRGYQLSLRKNEAAQVLVEREIGQ